MRQHQGHARHFLSKRDPHSTCMEAAKVAFVLSSVLQLLAVGPKHSEILHLAHQYMKPCFQLSNTFHGPGQGYLLETWRLHSVVF